MCDLSEIEYLLKKYENSYVKGEIHSTKLNTQIKKEERTIEKHIICDNLIDETNLSFSKTQVDFIHYLIDRFSDFKKLHGRAKKETILLAFIFYVKKVEDSRINLNNYSISKKYNLTDTIFKLIICRMCDDFIKTSAIRHYETKRYDHETLSKNGGRVYPQ